MLVTAEPALQPLMVFLKVDSHRDLGEGKPTYRFPSKLHWTLKSERTSNRITCTGPLVLPLWSVMFPVHLLSLWH